jgi:hypothetical protein
MAAAFLWVGEEGDFSKDFLPARGRGRGRRDWSELLKNIFDFGESEKWGEEANKIGTSC